MPKFATILFIYLLISQLCRCTNAFGSFSIRPMQHQSLPTKSYSALAISTALAPDQNVDESDPSLDKIEVKNGPITPTNSNVDIGKVKAAVTKALMVSYIGSMCIALPLTLFPVHVMHRAKLITKRRKEMISLDIGQFCSRWLVRLFPFASIKIVSTSSTPSGNHEPTIWVCNHTSMLDVFILLATDKRLRGKNKRPIKIIYWKDLEKNPITNLLFKMSGFIPVEMEDNGNGNSNVYNKSSFKVLLKNIKQAFDDGFDVGILPEGQLNICPEKGLQPVFPGAYTLSKMSRRPIRMLGLHGLHNLWHGDEKIGMKVKSRKVSVRNYDIGSYFMNSDEFVEAFRNVVGHWGALGNDLPGYEKWLDGSAFKDKRISS